MAATNWLKVSGQEFTPQEARAASDFGEIVENYDLAPDVSYAMFKGEGLDVGKRLYFAGKVSVDVAAQMVFDETDPRLREVLKARMGADKLKEDGGIVI